MADAPQIGINSTLRVFFASAALLYFAGLIVWLVKEGNPVNGLHATAMTGSLLLIGGLLGVLVSPTLADLVLAVTGKAAAKT